VARRKSGIDVDANETIWHVKHDDSDSEDFCAREIGAAVLDTDDEGSNSGEGASSAASPPSPNQSLRGVPRTSYSKIQCALQGPNGHTQKIKIKQIVFK
jgi:hypothetical protein